jgi:murein DD-endopeptidase MepM/ murein hydrolase activator NlpD
MPHKGTEGIGLPITPGEKTQSETDFNDREDSLLYGLDMADGSFWLSPNDPVPLPRHKPAEHNPPTQAPAAEPLPVNKAQGMLSAAFNLVADFGDAVLGVLLIAGRKLIFIPRFFGAIFSRLYRGVRAVAEKAIEAHKRERLHEGKILQRELRGIRPYLKKANGNPANWLRRLSVVIRKLTDNHRSTLGRIINVALPTAAALLLLAVLGHWSDKTYALQVIYNGETVGYIRSEAVFNEAEKLASERIILADNESGGLEQPMYALVSVPVSKLNDSETLSDRLVENSGENLTNAVGIFIDKKFLCSVKNRSDAESVFDALLAPYRTNEANTYVDFVEDITYEEGYYPDDTKTMWDASQLAKKLKEQKQAERTYTIKAGDSIWSIANENGLSEAQLLALNPKYKTETLWAGEKMVVSAQVNYVQVKVMKTETRIVDVPFETIYTSDPTLFTGVTRTVSAGVKGKEKVTELVTYLDGARVSAKEISRERISEPVSAKVSKGTKSLSVSSSSGSVNVTVSKSGFVWPAPSVHTITDRFGYRWGGRSFHQGVDLAGGYGTIVVAALDGTVESAGYSGSYGNRVVINHGGGVKTTYNHMMTGSIADRAGQYVTAGQAIGRIGLTGYTTGAHLHFELMLNGRYVDPLPYIR